MMTYSKEVEDETDNIEKSIDERASTYTPPIPAEKSLDRSHTRDSVIIIVVEVPLNGISWDDKVDYIDKKYTWVSNELNSPNEFYYVEDLKDSTGSNMLVDLRRYPGWGVSWPERYELPDT